MKTKPTYAELEDRVKELEQEAANLKQAEDVFESNSVLHRILFDQSPDGILIVNPETAGFIEFNTAAHQQLGYTREEFAKLTIPDIEAKETVLETKQQINAVLQSGRADFETLQFTKQGEIRNILVTAHIVDIKGDPVYHCVWRDITKRKQLENEKENLIKELQRALDEIKSFQGIIPICSSCKKIRDDKGSWNRLEAYIESHSDVVFSHGICPDCCRKLYSYPNDKNRDML